MRKPLRRTIAIGSTLLLVMTVGIWARGQWYSEGIFRYVVLGPEGAQFLRTTELRAYRGSLVLELRWEFPWDGKVTNEPVWRAFVGPPSDITRIALSPLSAPLAPTFAGRCGFACGTQDRLPPQGTGGPYPPERTRTTTVAAPWWFLTLLFAVAPALALRRWRRCRRPAPHECLCCRYDLRATADPVGPLLETCPECGRATGTRAR